MKKHLLLSVIVCSLCATGILATTGVAHAASRQTHTPQAPFNIVRDDGWSSESTEVFLSHGLRNEMDFPVNWRLRLPLTRGHLIGVASTRKSLQTTWRSMMKRLVAAIHALLLVVNLVVQPVGYSARFRPSPSKVGRQSGYPTDLAQVGTP